MKTPQNEVLYESIDAIEEEEVKNEVIRYMEENPGLVDLLTRDLSDSVAHGIVVSKLATMVAKNLNASPEYAYRMSIAGFLYDIGKLMISDFLYGRESGTLRIEEVKYIRMHSKLGFEILKKNNYDDIITESVLHHHENYDGSGYPDNLKGLNIPFGARILRVCDVFSALISDRPYRGAYSCEEAMQLLISEVKNFDMRCFLALQRAVNRPDFAYVRDLVNEQNKNFLRTKRLRSELNLDLW